MRLERFIRNYLITILFIAAFSGGYWYFKTEQIFKALQVVTSILVVSCPCASGVAIPLVDDRAAVRMRRWGVYIRESSLWHRIRKVRKIVFDKTGTLTLENLECSDTDSLSQLSPQDQRTLAWMVRESLHPVAVAIRSALGIPSVIFDSEQKPPVHEVIGQGIEYFEKGICYRLGKSSWALNSGGDEKGTVFARNGKWIRTFEFSEKIREEAAEMIQHFHLQGKKIYLLSGDRRQQVTSMAQTLGIPLEHVGAELTPQEKEARIRQINQEDTLMLGDGANDSLAFNQSLCTGTPAIDRGFLQKKADFYWMGKSLRGIEILFSTADRRKRTIEAILIFTFFYNVVVILLSFYGKMNPVLAVILMPLSSLITLAIGVIGMRERAQGLRTFSGF